MSRFEETIRDYATRGKDALISISGKAADHLQDAGDSLVATLDTRRLKRRLDERYRDLGKIVWEYHRDGKRLSLKTKEAETILDEISRIETELDDRSKLKPADTE